MKILVKDFEDNIRLRLYTLELSVVRCSNFFRANSISLFKLMVVLVVVIAVINSSRSQRRNL
ncbi:hypothetical protein [Natranaerobius trueperi]|uniref:hypothetical protein n=1 Tax=Natranaerobius trueperi TaxID=759412 RepID=UPI001303D36C|nr:hypothetical protein [Natranaerobius trueperi]